MGNEEIKKRILFVDDDVTLGNIVTLALNDSGYETYYQSSLAGIHSVINEVNPAMILFDVEIGQGDGIDTASRLQALLPDTPILIISSHIKSSEVVRALNAGAVAYLKKPFEIEELLAYIERYATKTTSDEIPIGHFTLNTRKHILSKNGATIKTLSAFESKLLCLLIAHKNQLTPREEINQALWKSQIGNEQSLNNYIAKLRKYLQTDSSLQLITVKNAGYMLNEI